MADRRRLVRANAGFTLLELMIAMLILALIVGSLTAGVRFAGRAWQTQERRMAQQDDLMSLQDTLRQLVATGRHFAGSSDRLRFVGPLPRALARSGLFDISLETSQGELRIAWQPHLKGAFSPAEPVETDLASGVDGLQLVYYTADANSHQGAWHPAWSDSKQLPELIKIGLVLSPGDARSWPLLVVAPQIEAPAVDAPAATAPGTNSK